MKTFALASLSLAQASNDIHFADAATGAGAISRQSGSSDLTLTNDLELNLAESLAQPDRGAALGFEGATSSDTIYIVREKGTLNLHITPVTADLIVKGKSLAADMTCRQEFPKIAGCAVGEYMDTTVTPSAPKACPRVAGCAQQQLTACAADGTGSYCLGCASGFYSTTAALSDGSTATTNQCTKCDAMTGCGTNEMGNSMVSCDAVTGLGGFCKECGPGYADVLGAGIADNTCVKCASVDGCTAANTRCAADGSGSWCTACKPMWFGTEGNDVSGNQCTRCTGNEGNALNCVNGNYHQCQASDGTLSQTGTYCAACPAPYYGTLGDGVEGNQCTPCPDTVSGTEGTASYTTNALKCVNKDYTKCTTPGGDGTLGTWTNPATGSHSWCAACPAPFYGTNGDGVEGNECTPCPDTVSGTEGTASYTTNALKCVNKDYTKCTTPGGDGTLGTWTNPDTGSHSWCAACMRNGFFGTNGDGVVGNQCVECSSTNVLPGGGTDPFPGNVGGGDDTNPLKCVHAGYHRCADDSAGGTRSPLATWCDHCPANGYYGTIGNGKDGNKCLPCGGNDGNVLNCVHQPYHKCSKSFDGTKSDTPTWCDHCPASNPISQGGGVGSCGTNAPGNSCTSNVCPA
jgi:hypothetical protein